MVKHLVLWKLQESANGKSKLENAQEARQVLEALNAKIPVILKLEVGFDFSNTENSADLVLYSEFESKEALKEYQDHPDHVAVRPFIMEITSERKVIDYEI